MLAEGLFGGVGVAFSCLPATGLTTSTTDWGFAPTITSAYDRRTGGDSFSVGVDATAAFDSHLASGVFLVETEATTASSSDDVSCCSEVGGVPSTPPAGCSSPVSVDLGVDCRLALVQNLRVCRRKTLS